MRDRSLRVASSAMILSLWAFLPHPAMSSAECLETSLSTLDQGLLIVEFYPCGVSADEYFVLGNPGDLAVPLERWAVTDGEGTLTFSNGSHEVRPGCTFVISENGTSFLSAFGRHPDLIVPGWKSTHCADVAGSFRMADAGDGLYLLAPDGAVVDSVLYGDTDTLSEGWAGPPIPSIRRGEVVKRALRDGGLVDTGRAEDWTSFREYKYGYTTYTPRTALVGAGSVTAFVSPDASLAVVLRGIESATETIRACSYEVSSTPVCSALTNASARGVDVRLLVEGSPVGGMSDHQSRCLSVLSREGAEVLLLKGDLDGGVVRHIGVLHSKYIVVDSRLLIVLSENLVEDGLPVDELRGNRGWGLSIREPSLAAYVASVFDDDSRMDRPDVVDWESTAYYDSGAMLPPPPSPEPFGGQNAPFTNVAPATLDLFLSPDTNTDAPYLAELVDLSRSACAEVFQSDLLWKLRWSEAAVRNPLVCSIESVMRSGGSARLLFDSTWYNQERNAEVASFLEGVASSEGLDGQFRMMSSGGPITALHNKGVAMDGLRTVVSSSNWVCSAFSRNRELAIVATSAEIADYFLGVFELDWSPDVTPPVANAGSDIVLRTGQAVTLDASGSHDDRAISNISWDIDSDGIADSYGTTCKFSSPVAGDFRVTLNVRDAWGNLGSTSVIVTVVDLGTAPEARPSQAQRSVVWLVPLVPPLAYALIRFVRRRKG